MFCKIRERKIRMTITQKTQWHPAFCSAMHLELLDYEEHLEYINEYNLTKKPLQIDLLILKKNVSLPIHHEIGQIFKGHNIIEYKSPEDSFNEDTFFKVMGYACLYKSSEKHVGNIETQDITVTFVRKSLPGKLLKWLRQAGFSIRQHTKGIFYIENVLGFFVQIIVSGDISKESSKWITLLNNNLTKEDARRAILQSNSLFYQGEREYADSVLQVAMAENKEVFDLIKAEGDDNMCDALRQLMEPEFTQALTEAKKIAAREGREEGRTQGENDFASLVSCLLKDGLTDVLEKITTDTSLRKQ